MDFTMLGSNQKYSVRLWTVGHTAPAVKTSPEEDEVAAAAGDEVAAAAGGEGARRRVRGPGTACEGSNRT